MIVIEKYYLLRCVRYMFRKIKEMLQKVHFIRNGLDGEKNALEKLNNILNKNHKRVFVIGNGPSLNELDLSLLKDEFTICSNAFFLKYPEIDWKPTILTIEDPLPAQDNQQFYNNDQDSLKIIPYDLRKIIKKNKTTIYINFLRSYLHSSRKNWPKFSFDFRKKAYWGGTVSYLSLQIAATFNPEYIYIIGTDLNYTIPESAKIEGTIITSFEKDPNHFNAEYFGEGKKWHIPETWRMQIAFDKARAELELKGINLLNATVGGNLKNITRVNFTEIFR